METESQVNFNENYWLTRVKKGGKTARGQGMTDTALVCDWLNSSALSCDWLAVINQSEG